MNRFPPMKFSATVRIAALALLFLVSIVPLSAQRPPAADDGSSREGSVQVLSSNDRGIVLMLEGLEPRLVGAGGLVSVLTNAPRHTHVDSGALPRLYFEVAVPHDADRFTATLSAEGAPSFREIGSASLRPSSTSGVTVGKPTLRRGFRLLPVTWSPFQLEGNRIRYNSSARITIGWSGGKGAPAKGGAYNESRAMEAILAGSILNFSSARHWYRSTERPQIRLQSAGGWGIGNAIVLTTPGNGIYAISADELAATGADDILGVPLASLGLSNRRTPVPFNIVDAGAIGTFDRGDRIEFMGTRFRGDDGLYLSDVTDTNAYLLKWDGSVVSPRIAPTPDAPSAPLMTSYDSTLHFEVDNFYFGGHRDAAWGDVGGLHVSERVPGERFYWSQLENRDEFRYQFNCWPHYEPGATITVELRFLGLTDQLHRVEVAFNEYGAAGVAEFFGKVDTTFTFEIPASFLVAGRNQLKLRTDHAESPVVWTDFDYFRLSGRWQTVTADAAPRLTIGAGAPGPRRVEMIGGAPGLTAAISQKSRSSVEKTERGILFTLSSRQFESGALRINSGFVAQWDTFSVASRPYDGGVLFAEVDPRSGALIRSVNLNIHGIARENRRAAYQEAVDFLKNVAAGNVVVGGFSIGLEGEPPPPDAEAAAAELRSVLTAMGSTIMNRGDLGVSSWAFYAIKGNPALTRERFASLFESGVGVTLSAFHPSEQGKNYRSTVTLDGTTGEEFQLGAEKAPAVRHHPADLLTGVDNRADLVIITHPKFREESDRLAAHRETINDLKTKVVDVRTIYDEFNAGIKSPQAIRQFLQYADTNWSEPKPGFVLLMGDGTWDPMRRLSESIMDDYIPTYGIPASDYLYTVPIRDTTSPAEEDLDWRQLIARLPAITAEDARAMVDKLIEYDTLAPAAWNKRFVFLAGGGNPGELRDNIDYYSSIMRDYIAGPLFAGDTALVARTSTNLAIPDALDAPRAQAEVNKGALWVSFAGHGSTYIFDLDFGYPEDFDIDNRYFVLGTFSCRTGDFAVNAVKPRNEYFMTAPHAGSIAAIGATGYSYSDINKEIETGMYAAMTSPPYQTNIASIMTGSVKQVFDQRYSGSGAGTFEGVRARNHLTMYTLLGDPSMDLVLSPLVELALPIDRASFTSERDAAPTPADSVVIVDAQLWNHGRPVDYNDSVLVVATIINDKREEFTDSIWVTGVGRFAETSFRLPLAQKPGEYTVRIEADPAGRFLDREGERRDNILVLTLQVRGNQPLPIEPVPNGRVASYDDVTIHLLNPATGPGAEIIVDTTAAFSSAAPISSRTVGSMTTSELTTTWTFSIPQEWRASDGAPKSYWYKAISTSGDPDAAALFPLVETFTVDADPAGEFIIAGREQISEEQIFNLVNTPEGVGPGTRAVEVLVSAMGQTFLPNGAEIQRVLIMKVEGRNYMTTGRAGINIVVLPPDDVTPVATGAFAFYSGEAELDRFLSFINDTIKPGQRVLLGSNGVSFDYLSDSTHPRSEELRRALESIGGSEARNLGKDDSYALIGGKGVPASEIFQQRRDAAELLAKDSIPPFVAVVQTTFTAVARSGSVATSTIGPATSWRTLDLVMNEGEAPRTTVYGVRRDGVRDSLIRSNGESRIDLGGIDVSRYPRLELRSDFGNDSTQRLRRIDVDYDPAPELALLPSTFRLAKDSVLQGDRVELGYTVINLSRRYAANDIGVRLGSLGNEEIVPVDSVRFASIAPSGRVDTVFSIITDRMEETNRFTVVVNPADQPSEPYRQNNTLASGLLRVGRDEASPDITFYADGNRLMEGDYVSPNATFEIRIFDNSRLKLDSTAIRKVIIDDDVIEATRPGTRFVLGETENGPRATFYYTPEEELESGQHMLRVYTEDASGNVDTTDWLTFHVERGFVLKQVVNVPNPFAEKTAFTFMIGGGSAPTGGEISIFTLSGRKIRSIPLGPLDLRIGFNKIDWNAVDEDGDRLANGVYFYRIRVDDGENRQEMLEKLVIMK